MTALSDDPTLADVDKSLSYKVHVEIHLEDLNNITSMTLRFRHGGREEEYGTLFDRTPTPSGFFGEKALDQLTVKQLQKDVNKLEDHGGRVTTKHPEGRPLAPKTVRHIAFLVQACLDQAVDWDYITKNPMRKVKKPKVPKRRPAIVDRSGFDRLLDERRGWRSIR
jgi:hypothetical protein